MSIVYIIENTINNKVYIGKTLDKLNIRWNGHKSSCKREEHKNRPLYRAMNKYGVENFSIRELPTIPELSLEQQEIYYITKYDSYKNGYNATRGGDGSSYLEVDDSSILEHYLKSTSMRETARFFNIDRASVKRALARMNVEQVAPNMSRIMTQDTPSVVLVEFDRKFESLTALAEYLIEAGISTTSINRTKEGIKRVLNGDRKSYLKLSYKYSEDNVGRPPL